MTLTRLYSPLKIEATRSNSTAKKDAAFSANCSSLKSKYYKKKDHSNDANNYIKCSLGHPGHTDEKCRVRRFRAFVKYEKKLKSEESSFGTQSQVAQAAQSLPTPETDPFYWESAFLASVVVSVPTLGDTGAMSHMFSEKSMLFDITAIPSTRIGVASKDGVIRANHKGMVSLGSITLKDVLFSPKLTRNLISFGRLCDDGYRASFDNSRGIILDQQGREVLRLRRSS